MEEFDQTICISYKTYDKINSKLKAVDLEEIERVYSIYSNQEIAVEDKNFIREIKLPKLIIKD